MAWPGGSWREGWGLKNFETLDSTNAEARRLGEAGEGGPLWISAARQTAGRGRRGRAWHSPEGNLAATLLIRPDKPAARWPELSFVAAIAARDAIARFASDAEVRVKWPNDVLANKAKIAGILLESGAGFLVLGIGINLAHFPPDTEYPATSLAMLGTAVPSPIDALDVLAEKTAKWYEIWREDGFAPIRTAWLERASGLGARIRARLGHEERLGVFEGIDSTGALLLEEGGKTSAISAADIFPADTL